jgi:membrane AbrB-like protein
MHSLPAVAVVLVSGVCGYFASVWNAPLAWVLGPMVPTAVASMLGIKVIAPRRGRKVGQLMVGVTIGLSLTTAAVGLILTWFPLMLLTALISMLVTGLLCVPFSRASRVDVPTAFFSLTPGGLAEMAMTGAKEGAQSDVVAMTQTVRVALLVCILPWLLKNYGIDGGIHHEAGRLALPPSALVLVFACAALIALLFRSTGAGNPWMIGGLTGGGTLAAFGLVDGHIPYPLFALGQFLIGIAIGSGFKRDYLVKLPLVCAMAVIFIVAMTLLLFFYAVSMHLVTGMDLSSAALAVSPGGLAEMALTAQLLHLNVGLVTVFHVVRSFLVNAFSQHFYRLFKRIGLFDKVERILDR